jgi:hypothetical protein
MAVVPSLAAAQRVTITPTIGAFAPASALDRWSVPSSPPCDVAPCDPIDVRMALEPGFTWGVTAATRLTGTFGIEVSVTTTATQRHMRFDPDNNALGRVEGRGAARHSVTTIRATFERPVARVASLGLAVGVSRTMLSGEALIDLRGDTTAPPLDAEGLGVSLAATIGFELSPRARAQFRIADNVYRVEQLRGGGARHMQHDIQLAMGVGVVLFN